MSCYGLFAGPAKPVQTKPAENEIVDTLHGFAKGDLFKC